MTERQELEQIKRVVDAVKTETMLLFQMGFCAGVGANINKGEKEAIRLGTLTGLACLRGLNDAKEEAKGQIEQYLEERLDAIFEKPNAPKVEIVPAHAVNKNGQLVN